MLHADANSMQARIRMQLVRIWYCCRKQKIPAGANIFQLKIALFNYSIQQVLSESCPAASLGNRFRAVVLRRLGDTLLNLSAMLEAKWCQRSVRHTKFHVLLFRFFLAAHAVPNTVHIFDD